MVFVKQDSKKKFFKRGDLQTLEEEQYKKSCGQTTQETHTDNQVVSADSRSSDDNPDVVALPRTEVIQRLRDRGEPILFFGELELEAFRRLRRCEILEPEVNRVSNKINNSKTVS